MRAKDVPHLGIPAASATTATYTVTFDAEWSQATHPDGFPPAPHFSGLIGATHSTAATFWTPGATASPGIESMAELGSKQTLIEEFEESIAAGHAHSILSGSGVRSSPGSVSLSFETTSDYSLVTLVSMLAPSPDWFVGVSLLDLRASGQWVDSLTVPLHVYDAGTDSGSDYVSVPEDLPTDPPELIREKTDGPFSESNTVGTFTFIRTSAVGIDIVNARPNLILGIYPVPASDQLVVTVDSDRSETLSVWLYDPLGRMIRRRSFTVGVGTQELRLVIDDLAAGVYLARFQASSRHEIRPFLVTR
jgi:hypothetical protein